MTLSKAVLPELTRLGQLLLVLGGSLFVALAAQVSVPMLPVPMTLQTMAVLIVGFVFGARLGAATLVAYLAEGAMGLPVFSNGHAGIVYLFGPTTGFLLGFVPMAWLAGLAAELGFARRFPGTALTALAISALIYVPGVAGVMAVGGLSLGPAVSGAMLPFLAGDAVKSIIAALSVSGGWAALRARDG